ncbi:hypothetical protein [Haloarcula salinisoli]|uniref:Uncharacterized protein n=1 Tax=Haloarcula salinisoli TaxID=2487746 RepID=A0A8J7YGJ4_9EURY|nr:hypothetical protein [Halomicroarcula salinisoli]MBX0302911.1 hypothetical protein [Halomicroarcula salinisoli]
MPVVPGLVAAAILIVGLFTFGRLVGWWLGRSEEITPRQRSVFDILVTLVLLFLMVGVPMLYRLFPVGYALSPSKSLFVGSLLTAAISTTVAVLGFGGALLGLRPFLSDRMQVRGELWRRNRIVLGAWVGIIPFAAMAIELGVIYAERQLGVLVAVPIVVFAGLYLSGFVALPAHCPVIRFGIRRPTAEERDRIEAIYERLDIPLPNSIEITVDDDNERLVVVDNDDERVLALSDSLLPAVDDDTLAVAIAHSEGRARHDTSFFEKLWMGNLVLATVLYVWAFSMQLFYNDLSTELVQGAVVLLLLIVFVNVLLSSWNRTRIYLADEYTIEHTVRSCVTAVYRNSDERLGCIQRRRSVGNDLINSVLNKLVPEPQMKHRLEHIGLEEASNPPHSDQQGGDPDSIA